MLFAMLFAEFVLGAGAQTIDSEKSNAYFEIEKLGFLTVEGTFTGMSGTVKFDKNNLSASSFDVCVSVETVNTGIGARDKHLKTADFFDADKFPSICFVSSSIEATAEGYMTDGELTLHGVTKKISIPFTYSENTLKGEIAINRFDYGLGAESYSGTAMVGEIAEIVITCVLNR